MAIESFKGEYEFLSNFYPCKILFDGFICKSVEAAFQASKTWDDEMRLRIALSSPGEAKRLGKKCALREDWEQVKNDVMYAFVYQKFTNDIELGMKLLATGDEELVEGNTWHDTYWGVYEGRGRNQLGKTLMRVRYEVRDLVSYLKEV